MRFLQLEENFLNHLLTVLWSIARTPFTQQMFLIASVALWPSSLVKAKYWIAKLAGGVEYTDCFSAYDTKQSDGEVPVTLWNAEYPIIAITPRSTLAHSGSTW